MDTANNVGSAAQPTSAPGSSTLGNYLARRLVEIGTRDVFSVPGDFNLTLLDHLRAEPQLNLIGCCNDLNAGYAADGYARARGVGACVVTFMVGGLSVLNAIAGAYSENLPVICIVGGPDSNEYGTSRIMHHTIGLPDFSLELRCFQSVTCTQAVVNNLDDAQKLIDAAISTALKESKPAYISISRNLLGIRHPTFSRDPIPFSLAPKISNPMGLEAAVEATGDFLNKAVKPVIVGGPKLRVARAQKAFMELVDASGYPITIMPSGKGLVPEHHPHFIGTCWGAGSTSFAGKIVESADAYIFVGPFFDDDTSVDDSLLIKKEKAIIVQPNRVTVGNGPSIKRVFMADFLSALAKKLKRNTTALENYRKIDVPRDISLKWKKINPVGVNLLFKYIQDMLDGDTAVIAETGDSRFNCQELRLPENCGYEFQMRYGSMGWSIGATLGYAQAATDKRVIACIGDGSFQVTAQDISTMIRCEQKSIIFLINPIEKEIHDGPYNVIKKWNYTGLVDAIDNGEGKCWTAKVRTEEELMEAIATATGPHKDCLCFIEVIVHKDDTSKKPLEGTPWRPEERSKKYLEIGGPSGPSKSKGSESEGREIESERGRSSSSDRFSNRHSRSPKNKGESATEQEQRRERENEKRRRERESERESGSESEEDRGKVHSTELAQEFELLELEGESATEQERRSEKRRRESEEDRGKVHCPELVQELELEGESATEQERRRERESERESGSESESDSDRSNSHSGSSKSGSSERLGAKTIHPSKYKTRKRASKRKSSYASSRKSSGGPSHRSSGAHSRSREGVEGDSEGARARRAHRSSGGPSGGRSHRSSGAHSRSREGESEGARARRE